MRFCAILLGGVLAMAASSCVHRTFDFPDPEVDEVEVNLAVDYHDLEMPLLTVVNKEPSQSRQQEAPVSRHIIKIYQARRSEPTAQAEVISKVEIDQAENYTLARRHTLSLTPGEYTAVCWTDFAASAADDRHYDTSGFPNMLLRCEKGPDGWLEHTANSPWRDAFAGRRSFTVRPDGSVVVHDGPSTPGADPDAREEGNGASEIRVEMRRPMAALRIEATDYMEFASRYDISPRSADPQADPMPGYKVTVRYTEFLPCSFSALTDGLTDSRTGACFTGQPRRTDENGNIVLGTDYIFVNPLETSVKIMVEISDEGSGETVARTGPLEVPLLRNHLTVVRGFFLTGSSAPGILIDTGFAGEYNIPL